MKPIITGALAALCVTSLAANALLYLRYSTARPLVRVGGEAITRKDYQDAADSQVGKAILGKMVYGKIVMQAAARAGVAPTPADVDARLADWQRRGSSALDQAMQDPAKAAQIRQDLTTEIALENLRIRNVPATTGQIAAFYAKNRRAFAVPVQVQSTMVMTDNTVDAATAASLLKQNMAVDVIARQPRLRVVGVNGFSVNLHALPPAVAQSLDRTVLALKPGQVTTVPFVGHFLTVRATRVLPGGVPPLSRVEPQVVRLVKLANAPTAQAELATLYHEANPQFQVEKYAAFFDDVRNATPEKPRRTASRE